MAQKDRLKVVRCTNKWIVFKVDVSYIPCFMAQ